MATPRLMPLTQDERERLKHALLQSDDETRRFLGPLLAMEPVQHLLLSYTRDESRSFENHVWDPVSQGVLNRLRDTGPGVGSSDTHAQTNAIFEAALVQQMPGHADDDEDLMTDVDTAQADGKAKFKRGDHYAAMNAFKKSLLALLKYHEDQYYGQVIDPQEWEEDDLRERYTTLCCNVAVCGIKLRDCAMVRLYATKALRVNDQSSKAIYALGKVNLLEHRFDAARSEVTKGLRLFPSNKELTKLLKEIDAAEVTLLEDRVGLLAIKELNDKAEEEARERRQQEEAEQRAKLERAAEVTRLPTLHEDDLVFQRLNTYFMRIKQSLRVTIDQLHNPDNGDPPLFECNIVNGSTGVALATGQTASSKKAAKQKAAKAAVQTLWKMKRDTGKLLPEDQEHWEEYEKAQRDGTSLTLEPMRQKTSDDSAVVAQQPRGDDKIIQLTMHERRTEPAALLHQLGMQRRLRVDFNMEDVAPSKFEPLFKCTCVINGEVQANATAPGKKKAKAEAGRLAMDAAVAKGIIQYVRTVAIDAQEIGAEAESAGLVAAEVA